MNEKKTINRGMLQRHRNITLLGFLLLFIAELLSLVLRWPRQDFSVPYNGVAKMKGNLCTGALTTG